LPAHTPKTSKKHYHSDLVMQMQAQTDTTFFQFCNKFIVSLYSITSPDELSDKTSFFIRLSPTLWPLLSGEITDRGHPDAAIYQHESDPAGKEFDLDFYETYGMKNEIISIPLLGFSKGKSMPINASQYKRSKVDPTYIDYKRIKKLPYPDWLKPKKKRKSIQRQRRAPL
jgi:hypothetical protein